MWYPIKNPCWLAYLYPKIDWKYAAKTPPTIYLTFDDGPTPNITNWVLKQLKMYQAQATFFCVGKNVAEHPLIYERIKMNGHQIGNHTYSHLHAWKYTNKRYLEDIKNCTKEVNSPLFRPPYGRLKWGQAKKIQKMGYKIILWDVMAGDFDKNITAAQCWKNILQYLRNGSILVLHDSEKAWPRLQYVLPKLLDYYWQLGYKFKKIPI